MSGIGKFPFITVNHEKLDFESLTVGKVTQKTIDVRNYSQVKAEFHIETINDDGKDDSITLS
jgi:P pilus assembly chaperone PapD